MFFVAGIFESLQEILIAGRTADIFWRAATGPFEEDRIDEAGDGGRDLLDLDRVLPAIAKIVEVLERLYAGIGKRSAQARMARVDS